MTKNIKNFIEEGEKESFEELKKQCAGHYDVSLPPEVLSWHSSRQISLIKMIVEMVESEKKDKVSSCCGLRETYCKHTRQQMICDCGGGACPCGNPSKLVFNDIKVHNQALDTISSKLKELIK